MLRGTTDDCVLGSMVIDMVVDSTDVDGWVNSLEGDDLLVDPLENSVDNEV